MRRHEADICVVGLGPAGLGAALSLARSGVGTTTVCLEAGVPAKNKYCSILQKKGCRFVQPCQMITGVGGSSVLSGGKISLFPAGRGMSRIIGGEQRTKSALKEALSVFQEFVPLQPPSFDADHRTQIVESYRQKGFDFRYYDSYLYRRHDLIAGYDSMMAELHGSGVSLELGAEVESVLSTNSGFTVLAEIRGNPIAIQARDVVLAVGRYGTRLLDQVAATLGLTGETNHCDVGVRLEFPTAAWTDTNRHHNDLKLHWGNARTFCVCTDGFLAPYRYGDIFLLEGSSEPGTSTGFTNLGITIRHEPHGGGGQRGLFQEVRERLLKQTGGPPVRQPLQEFLSSRTDHIRSKSTDRGSSSITYWRWGDVSACFPEDVASAVRESVGYFASRLLPTEILPQVSVYAPELDYYWPRYPLRTGFETEVPGLHLVGDGSGHFRGILQAFSSGRQCVQALVGATHAT